VYSSRVNPYSCPACGLWEYVLHPDKYRQVDYNDHAYYFERRLPPPEFAPCEEGQGCRADQEQDGNRERQRGVV
jgi:hypothetical protein